MRYSLIPIMLMAAALMICLLTAGPGFAVVESADGLALAAESGSLLASIGKTVAALAVVVGLMLMLLFWLRKMGLGKLTGRPGSLISILETRLIAPKKYVTVLQVAGERFVVGITDQQINFLTSLKNDGAPDASALAETGAQDAPFAAFLRTAAGRLSGKERRTGEQETP